MAQDPNVPQNQNATPNEASSGAGHIDLDKVLLPKKPTPGKTPDSAQRVNAGALFEQEQNAQLTSPKPAAQPAPKKPAAPQKSASSAPKQPQKSSVAPLQTYQGDIESLVEKSNTSTISIAAAEARRRAQESVAAPEAAEPRDWGKLFKRVGMIVGGITLIAASAGALFLVYTYLTATTPVPETPSAPFISVDAVTPVTVPAGDLQRSTLMGALEDARKANTLSLGLIGQLAVYQPLTAEDGAAYVTPSAQALLPVLTPNIPADLLRSLTGRYLIGTHTYDGTQAFMLLETDTYEHGFAGMLLWERTMRGDLLPLFNRTPRPHIPEEGVATSSVGSVPQLLQTGFSDKIIDNRDTRVVLNTSGDILLLWASLGPNLFIITTNEYTFREVVSRLGL